MLDLAEDRLGNLCAQPVSTAPSPTLELGRHGSDTRCTAPTLATTIGLVVPCTTRGDVAVDPAAGQMDEIFFRAEARIGGQLLGLRRNVVRTATSNGLRARVSAGLVCRRWAMMT
jgi:hypothetical protein